MKCDSSSAVANITLDSLTMTLVQLLSMMLGVKNSGVNVFLTVPMTDMQRKRLLTLVANPEYAAYAQVEMSSGRLTTKMGSG
jgi:hypothetical protein